MVEEETCYLDFGYCARDTFHQEDLRKDLADLYRRSRYAVIGKVDSVHLFDFLDVSVHGQDTIRLPMHRESLWVSIEHVLKGGFPHKSLFFEVEYGVNGIDTITYSTLVDTPWVAAFDDFAHPFDLGIRPTQDCLFEPTAYLLTRNGIERRGKAVRMPGVSLPLRELLAEVGNPDTVWRRYPGLETAAHRALTLRQGPARAVLAAPFRSEIRAFDLAGKLREVRPARQQGDWDLDPGIHGSGPLILGFRPAASRRTGRAVILAAGADPALGREPKAFGACPDRP